jgi:hypothetical protein
MAALSPGKPKQGRRVQPDGVLHVALYDGVARFADEAACTASSPPVSRHSHHSSSVVDAGVIGVVQFITRVRG